MNNINPVSPDQLAAVAPDFAKLIDNQRQSQVVALASEYVTGVVKEFATQYAAAELPSLQARWNEWNTQIVRPVLFAGAGRVADDTKGNQYIGVKYFNIPFQHRGRVIETGVWLHLKPADNEISKELLFSALKAQSNFKSVEELAFKYRDDPKIWTKNPDTIELADSVGYEIPLEEKGKTRLLRRPNMQRRVHIADFVDAAELDRRASMAPLLIGEVEFDINRTVKGSVVDPNQGQTNPYWDSIDWQKIRDYVRSTLSDRDRERAAEKRLDSQKIVDYIIKITRPQMKELRTIQEFSDRLLPIIAQSDSFKKLIA